MWYDRQDIKGGDDWEQAIREGVRKSVAVIATLTPRVVENVTTKDPSWVRFEHEEALRYFAPVIPALLEKCDPPDYLKNLQYVDLAHMDDGTYPDFGRLLAALAKVLHRRGAWLADQSPAGRQRFIGRQAELEKVVAMLRDGQQDTLAITAVQGMGGIGKTMLAGELARRLRSRYPGGVLWVERGPEPGDPQAVLRTWAGLAGKQVEGNLDPHAVRGWLQPAGELLVVIDDIWPEDSAGVQTLLSALPPDADRVLTTRNEDFAEHLGARVYNLDKLSEADGIALLRDRMGEGHDEELLRRLWQAVDGHALSLELAAGRYRKARNLEKKVEALEALLTAGDIGDLESRIPGLEPDRDNSVLVNLATTREALEEADPGLLARFARLGVFPLGATFEFGALPVLWAEEEDDIFTPLGEGEAEEALRALLGYALLAGEEVETPTGNLDHPTRLGTRYSQHIILRAYALELLKESDAYSLAHYLHAAFYAARAQQYDDWNTARALFPDLPNLAAAYEFARATQDADLAFRLAAGSEWALTLAGEWGRLWEWLSDARDLLGEGTVDQESRRRRSRLLDGLATIASRRGNWDEAETLLHEALKEYEGLGDQRSVAAGQGKLADIAADRGDWGEAERLYREALGAFEELGDRQQTAAIQSALATLVEQRGDWDEAEALLHEALNEFERLGDQRHVAFSQSKLADIAANRGDWDEAERLYREALAEFEGLGDRRSVAASQSMLADITANRGDWDKAEQLFRKALAEFEGLGDRRQIAVHTGKLADIAAKRGEWDEAGRLRHEVLKEYEGLGDRRGAAVSQGKLADIAANRGEWNKAEQLCREALAVFEVLGDRREIAVHKGNLANIVANRGEWGEAERLYHEALKQFRALGALVEEAALAYNFAGILRGQGRLAEAVALMERVVEIDRQVNHPNLQSDLAVLERFQAELEGRPSQELVVLFVSASNLDEKRILLEGIPALLSPEMDGILEADIARFEGEGNAELVGVLQQHRDLLRACREQGVDETFSALAINQLRQLVVEFVNAPNLNEKRKLLEANPELLSTEADGILEADITRFEDEGNAGLVSTLQQHRDLLRVCRERGIEEGFKALRRDDE